MRNLVSCLMILFTISGCNAPKDRWDLFSPDNNIRVTVRLQEGNGELSYQASIKNEGGYQLVIQPSPLGLVTDQGDLSRDLQWHSGSDAMLIDEEYRMISGKQNRYHNLANEFSLTFSNRSKEDLIIQFRAYDDGLAFRYVLSGDENEERTIEKEVTGFTIPAGSLAWIPTYDTASGTTPAYETLYTNGIPSGTEAPGYPGWSFPALFRTGDNWLLISEANVYNYCGVHLEPVVENGTYRVRFPEIDERFGQGPSKPSSRLPWQTPWRFVIMGRDLNTIVQSGMVYHLTEHCRLEDTSWIKPGRASWSWWSSRERGRNLERLKDFTDLAAEMGWEYTLVDAGWPNMTGGTIKDLIDYADSRDVGLWLWYNSGGRRRGDASEGPGTMEDPQWRGTEMQRIHDLGVKGVKVDFFNSDKQHIMKLYQDILEDAAKYRLMVNFHGCTLPRGWRRTYPNLLSMEAVKGGECYRYDKDFPKNAPWMHTILFLVRNSVGPMDYTPVMFSDQRYAHKTTCTHELATAVLFESGMIHFADKTDSYRGMGEEVKEFLSKVPCTWEALELVEAYPGEYAVVARRSRDNTWYLAGINGKNEKRLIDFTPDFLETGEAYTAKTFYDQDGRSIGTGTTDISRNAHVELTMAPYGGFVYVIEEKGAD